MVASITIGNQSMIIATALKTYLVIASTKDNSSTRFNSIFFFWNCCNKWKREISISCRLNQYHWQFIVQINYVRLDITKIFYMQNMYGNYTKNHLKFWTRWKTSSGHLQYVFFLVFNCYSCKIFIPLPYESRPQRLHHQTRGNVDIDFSSPDQTHFWWFVVLVVPRQWQQRQKHLRLSLVPYV